MEKKKSKRTKIYKDVKSFTVKRSKWLRGDPIDTSALLNPHTGKMCCLGFYSLACGFDRKDIKGIPDPSNLILDRKVKWNTKLLTKNEWETKTCVRLMTINDSEGITNTKREKLLTEQFAKLGIKVEFVD